MPSPLEVTNNMAGDPNVTAAYNSPDGTTPLALVALNLKSPGFTPTLPTMMSVSTGFSFDLSTLQTGKLLVGFMDPQSAGAGLSSLHFTITREGAVVEDQTFATTAAANSYFDDHALDFGALQAGVTGTLDLLFSLEMTTMDDGTRYGTNFLIADVGLVSSILPGDYNGDHTVNAADYTVWRNNLGSMITLPNDTTPGNVTPDDYAVWKDHYGETAPASGATLERPVPSRRPWCC